MDKKRVLFICGHNSGRSQMEEAFLNDVAGDQIQGYNGTFLGIPDLPPSKSYNPCFSTVFSPLNADSLSVEDAIFIFFDIEMALIPISRVSQ